MTPQVTIVDYGSGNLLSMARGLEMAGGNVIVSTNPNQIRSAERLVLPGVGAFGRAMEQLKSNAMDSAVNDFVSTGRPFLGVCVGMQVLLESSKEFGDHAGLAKFKGHVVPVPKRGADGAPHPVPHIGWNTLIQGETSWNGTILRNLGHDVTVYFVHSYQGEIEHKEDCLATCDYDGCALTAAIHKDNITGLQFHPEKSGPIGLSILYNFLEPQ